MAADLLIRNIDSDLLSALAERAAEHGRTSEEEHREILRRALHQPHRPDPLEFIAYARALRAELAPQLFSMLDIDAAKRAGRK